MSLLREYAVTPDVFDTASYSGPEACGLHVQILKEVLLHEALVRDLRDGDWGRLILTHGRPWHNRGKELLKRLARGGRLVRFAASAAGPPSTDEDWCREALATHEQLAISGVVTTRGVRAAFSTNPLVSAIDQLTSAHWWQSRSPTYRLARQTADYKAALAIVLRNARSLMFIDPHLDPTRYGYREFAELLRGAAERSPAPLIELHRVCYHGSGPSRVILTKPGIESLFRPAFSTALSEMGLTAEVFVWDDFHDRYLLSDVVGISMQNGFDITAAANSRTTWSRMGREEKDEVQREFEAAAATSAPDRPENRHSLQHRFKVP